MIVPRLSICIATYKRADIIAETLASIISQATSEIEIIIVDGASPDDTESVVRSYQNQCPYLRYYRLPAKGGVDRDYCHAVSYAKGDYCWLMTDDDIVKPGAINSILDLLHYKYSLIILNAEVRDQTLFNMLEKKHLHLDVNTFYESSAREKLFIDTVTYLSFIGSVVIDRALWNAREKEHYIGTEFIHIGVIFQKELPNGAFALADPSIVIRYGNAQWMSRYFEVWMIKWPNLIWSFTDLNSATKTRICSRLPWNNVVTLLLLRAYGAYSLIEFGRFISGRLASRWRSFIMKMIAITPGTILNVLFVMYFKIISSHDVMIWHNLRTSRFNCRRYFYDVMRSLKRTP